MAAPGAESDPHTIDASKTIDRVIGTFEAGDQQTVRTRPAGTFRYIVSQRLIPTIGGGRIAALEIADVPDDSADTD